jgi:hypothetical protein
VLLLNTLHAQDCLQEGGQPKCQQCHCLGPMLQGQFCKCYTEACLICLVT